MRITTPILVIFETLFLQKFHDHRDENEIVHAISRFFENGSRITYYDRKEGLSRYSRSYALEKWLEIIAEAHTQR